MRASLPAVAAATALFLIAAPEPAEAQPGWRFGQAGGWPACYQWRDEGACPILYLNVTTHQGDASLSVEDYCRGAWRHAWGQADARQVIRQWLDGTAARGQGSLCIPLAPEVDEIVVEPLGGHCGYESGEASKPGMGDRLWPGGPGRLKLAGCHARLHTQAFGGIALRFADGYGFGDSYAEGHFYGVYDGFGGRAVGGTGASVFRIADFNSFHYRIEILAGGSAGWRQPFYEESGP